jgi:hypothetical protein
MGLEFESHPAYGVSIQSNTFFRQYCDIGGAAQLDWSETAAPPIAAVDNYVLAVDLTVFNCLSESKKLSNEQT